MPNFTWTDTVVKENSIVLLMSLGRHFSKITPKETNENSKRKAHGRQWAFV